MVLQVDDVIYRLTPYFENGKAGVLGGAGISISSGIPDALSIVKILIKQLGCDENDMKTFFSIKNDDDKGELPIAFEAIIGTIENYIDFVNPDIDFLTIFSQNFNALPTQNHYFWTNVLKNKKLQFIATTNFDTCFEQALKIFPMSEQVLCSYPNDYNKLKNTLIEEKIIKLHGCMTNPADIGTTIDQINNKHNIGNIDVLVEKIFKKDVHDTIIIVGYSCSDVMDIVPKIQNIGDSLKEGEKAQVIYWQYKPNGNVFEWDYLKNVQETNDIIKVKNAFYNYNNAILVSGDLSVFIEKFSGIIHSTHKVTFKINEPVNNPMFVLGALFHKAGMYDIAIKYYKKELERIEHIKNVDLTNERAILYRHLGDVYGLNDDIDNSLAILKQAVIILLKSKEANKTELLAESYYSLSESYEDKGFIQKAIRTAEKAVNIYLEFYNDENYPELAKIYSTLGEFYYKYEQPEIGLEYCKKSLSIRLSLFSEKHPDVANTYVNMGCCYSAMGKEFYDMAQICHEKSLEIRKNVYGLYHERVAQSYNNVGHIHYRKKEYTLALTQYQKVFEVFDKSSMGFDHYLIAATYENIGLVYYGQEDDKEALSYYFAAYETYYKIFKNDTNNYNFARLFYNIANACIGLKEYQKAKECLDSALEVAKNINLPQEHSFYVDIKESIDYIGLEHHLLAKKKLDSVLVAKNMNLPQERSFNKESILEQYPKIKGYFDQTSAKHLDLAVELAKHINWAKEHSLSVEIKEQFEVSNPKLNKQMTIQEIFEKGIFEYTSGNFNAAIHSFDNIIKSNTDYFMKGAAFFHRGNANEKLHLFINAIQDYDTALILNNGNYPIVYSNRGLSRMKLGEYEKAIKDFNIAIVISDNIDVIYYNRATVKMKFEKFQEAVVDYSKAIELNPECAIFYNGRGNAKYNMENYEDAIKDYDIAIEKEPQFVAAYNNRGNVKFLLNKTAEANEDFKTVFTLNPYKAKNYQWQHQFLNYVLPEFVHSITDYKSAINFGKEYANSLLLRILPLINAGKEDYDEIAKELVGYDDYFLQTTETDKKNRQFYETIYLQSIKIIALLQVSNINVPISHYTTIDVAKLLLFDASPLWLSSLTDTNDEYEGNLLFKVLDIDPKFISNNVNAFISCFVLGNDNPNMFRLYGKANKVENSGVCLTVSKDVFNQPLTLINTAKIENQEKATLFSCVYVYYDDNNPYESIYVTSIGGGNEDKKTEIQTSLNILKTIVNDNRNLNQSIIVDLLTHLRYLIKTDSWQTEKECRIIKLAFSDSPSITENPINKKVHINYLPIDKFITNIHIGCNTFNDEDKQKIFVDTIQQKGLSIRCNLSRHKNRI